MKTKPEFKTFCDTLPDLFTFESGRAVVSRADWAERRKELRAILERVCYGVMPPTPSERPRVQRTDSGVGVMVASIRVAGLMHCRTQPFSDRDFGINFEFYTPTGENAREQYPVIICGDGCWQRVTPEFVQLVTSRGYALCVFNRCDIVPDTNAKTQQPGGTMMPARNFPVQVRHPDCDFGAIAGWAWGFSRVMDALEALACVDVGRVAVCGHSRGGKASLLAGAFDSRFAAVFTNGSGSGGSGSWMFQATGAEPLGTIVTSFPTWFGSTFSAYADQESTLPFDSHFLKALCAPRPLLSSEALDDLWANPAGACITHAAAREVYRFLGCPDSFAGMHFRNGGHGHLLSDWTAMLDYCDACLYGKSLPWDPLYVPYDGLPSPFDKKPSGNRG